MLEALSEKVSEEERRVIYEILDTFSIPKAGVKMETTRVDDFIKITDCYLHKDSIKEIDGRWYEAEEKAWYIPLTDKNIALIQLLGAEIDDELKQSVKPKVKLERGKPDRKMPIRAAPYAHQLDVYNFAMEIYERSKQGVAILADMGTGKSLITIAVAGTLYLRGEIKRLLIVCPKSIVGVWEKEFEKFAGFDYTLAVLEGETQKKADTLRNMGSIGLQAVVINYESVWRLEQEIQTWDADMIVCDESSKIKNSTAKQAKSLHRLGRLAQYKAILTGTPITNSPLDFFSQYKFLDENIFGLSFYKFKARYAIVGGYGNHQIIGYKNMAELVEKAHSVGYRIKIEDAVDLPDKIDEVRCIELEKNAKRIYDSIDKNSYAELMQGAVTTTNILTRLLRLSQCTGGFIKDDENSMLQEVSRAKLEALEDILDECEEQGKKVVVFARFVPEIEAIEKMLKKRKIDYGIIHGKVKDRSEQVERFQNDDNVKVFIGQLQTTGMGLTLTAANVAVFYSLDFSYANYEQSRARIHRIGQTKKCVYIHLVAKNTVDEKVMQALKNKGDVAKLLIDDYQKLLGGQ